MKLINHLLDSTLTQPDPAFAQSLGKTVAGMAHFAGSGPLGETCGACAHLHQVKRHGRRINCCAKFTELMCQAFPSGRARAEGGEVPRGTPACRYFLPRAS